MESFAELKHQLIPQVEIFLNLRKEWDDLVLVKSLNLVIKILELENETKGTVKNSAFLQKCPEDEVEIKDGYAWKQFCKLNNHYQNLDTVLGEMDKFLSKVEEFSSQMEELVQKACKKNGTMRVYQTPIGLTWSIHKICDELIIMSTQYYHSLQFYHKLHQVIISDDSSMSEKQAALSYWASQPLMYEKIQFNDLLSIELPDLFVASNSTPRKSNQKKS